MSDPDSRHEPEVSVGYLCKRVAQLSQAGLEPVFAREGLTGIQWQALVSIHFARGRTCATLARDLSYDKGATTRLIDQLEQRGWVVRSREHDDRRLIALKLTGEGERLARGTRAKVVDAWNSWLSDWTAGEVGQALEVLQRLRATLERVA